MNTMYNICSEVSKELNSVEYISNELTKYKEFSSAIYTDQENKLTCCVVVNRLLVNTHYCDILIVGDTVGVDIFDYPAINVVCTESDNHIQLVAFGYSLNKEEEGFTLFFKILKELVEKEISERIDKTIVTPFGNLFVCDMCIAQRNVPMKVFEGTKIIHCREHLKRNIPNKCKKLNDYYLYYLCYDMFHDRTEKSENLYVNFVKSAYEKNENSNFLKRINRYKCRKKSISIFRKRNSSSISYIWR